MRKRQSNYIICVILTFLLLSMNIQVFANTVTVNSSINNEDITSKFKDKYFKEYVYKLIGKSSSKPILYSDVKNIKTLELRMMGGTAIDMIGFLSSLSGIEYFTALTTLDCSNNQLTAIDVSKNIRLTTLKCNTNHLTTLDISKNTALKLLDCSYNQLKTIDVSKNTRLTNLNCSGNQIKTLNVSKHTSLTTLECSGNELTTLDVNKNILLTHLGCGSNKLTTLDVSKNIALIFLNCYNNQLTTLDIGKNILLTDLECGYNKLITLDVRKHTKLTNLYCSGSQLTTLDVSKNTKLTHLYCSENQLTTLDISKNTALTTLYCNSNQLTTLDVSKNTALTTLYCNSNQLKTLDISENTVLATLYCESNQLITLDASKNTKLTHLYCSENQLTTLDVSKNRVLTILECSGNRLTTLDISKNTGLFSFNCSNNLLTTLYSSKDTWNSAWYSTWYRPQYIDSTSKTTTDSLVITIVTLPEINYLGVDHSPLVVGDTEKFTVTSKYIGQVQYRAFLFDGKLWNELTSGYSAAVDAKTPYVLPETSPFKLGKYRLSVWVKRAGEIGDNSNENYDTYYIADLNCVTRDNTNRVYANGAAKVETKGLTVKVNGIENIDGIKGPYLYRLFLFNPTSGIWSNGAKEYTESPSYTFDEPGTYVVIIHANTVNSTTWKNYLAGMTKGAYEAWKTVVVTVKNDSFMLDHFLLYR